MRNIKITQQQMADLNNGNVVIGFDFNESRTVPSRTYQLVHGKEKVKAKCTQVFGPPIKAHFVKL